MKQNINCLLTSAKVLAQSSVVILKLLLNTRLIQMLYMKLLMTTILIKKRKIFIVFDDMIADILGYEKRNPVVIELFVRG